MSIVKKQHYVWRHYLRSWADEEIIWSSITKKQKPIQVSLMGVAQERYFYKLIDLEDDEIKHLSELIMKTSPPFARELNFLFLGLFTSPRKGDMNKEEIREHEINLMENTHGKIENRGKKLLAVRTFEDFETLEKNNDHLDAILFLCFQYFRTKNMKKTVINGFKGLIGEAFVEKAWNIISYILATNVAANIVIKDNLKLQLIKNISRINFLTSDQPIFNLKNELRNENGIIKEVELFYPITPNLAIKLFFNESQSKLFGQKEIEEEEVHCLNNEMVRNADFFLFSDSKENLEYYIK